MTTAEIIEEIKKLEDKQESFADRDAEIAALVNRVKIAEAAAEKAAHAQRQAEEELDATKAAIEWTLGKLQIKDLFRARDSVEIGCAAEGWLEGLTADPRDTKRIDWINKFGRFGVGQDNQFVLVLPSGFTDEEVPPIYNVRHFIDVCMTTKPNGDSRNLYPKFL
jgi:hypothetical protein